jgi:hypothetical protein
MPIASSTHRQPRKTIIGIESEHCGSTVKPATPPGIRSVVGKPHQNDTHLKSSLVLTCIVFVK